MAMGSKNDFPPALLLAVATPGFRLPCTSLVRGFFFFCRQRRVDLGLQEVFVVRVLINEMRYRRAAGFNMPALGAGFI